MEQNVNNSVVEDVVSSEVLCEEAEGLNKKDLLKASGVLAGTIVVWEVGKKLCKKGYNKFVAPTKAGKFLSENKPSNLVTKVRDRRAAKKVTEEVAEVVEETK